MKAIALWCCTSVEADVKQGEDRENFEGSRIKSYGTGTDFRHDQQQQQLCGELLLFSAPIQNLRTWLLICKKNRHFNSGAQYNKIITHNHLIAHTFI